MRARSACSLCSVVLVIACMVAGCSDEEESKSQCEQFLELTAQCYESAGVTVQVNPAACDDPSAMTPLIEAQIACGTQYSETWCDLIKAANTDGGTIDPQDPDVLALNACIAEQTTASPCKEAIRVLADCGTYVGFLPECVDQARTMAQCINEHPEGACAALGGTAADADTDAIQGYQKCIQEGQTADAGTD